MHKLAFLLLSVFACSACENIPGAVCTDIGCDSSFSLTFNAEHGATSIGDYSVLVQPEGELPLSCSFRLRDTGYTCMQKDCVDSRECGQQLLVTYLGEEERVLLQYPRLEGELTIRISQDGNVLSTVVTEPNYVEYLPNGPGCDPVCSSALTEIAINR